MAKFQYVADGHTLVQTTKTSKEKVKVVTGEIVEIEDGIFSDGRLMMAGFQKIIDGIEDVVEAAANVAEEIKDAITGTDSEQEAAPEAPETTETEEKTEETAAPEAETAAPEAETAENAPETSEKEADDVTPAEDAENAPEAAPEAPVVETTVEDDGKDEITVEVVAAPAKKEAPKKK